MVPHCSAFSPLRAVLVVLHPEVVGDHETHAGVDPLELLSRFLESKGPVGKRQFSWLIRLIWPI